MKKLGIVILNWNGEDDTVNLLGQLNNQLSRKTFSILVIDNGSQNISNLKDKGYDILIENKSNIGVSAGFNQGVNYFKNKTEYTLLINNDIEIRRKDFIKILIERLEDDQDTIISTLLKTPDGKDWFSFGRYYETIGLQTQTYTKLNSILDVLFFKDTTRPDFLTGALLAFPNKDLSDNPFTNNYFAYSEDIYFCKKMQKRGYTLVIYKELTAIHDRSKSTRLGNDHRKLSSFQLYYWARNTILLSREFLNPLQLVIFFTFRSIIYTYWLKRAESKLTALKAIASGTLSGILTKINT